MQIIVATKKMGVDPAPWVMNNLFGKISFVWFDIQIRRIDSIHPTKSVNSLELSKLASRKFVAFEDY